MSKVLVTGANGFLGSWLVRKLCEQGHQVSILARKSSDLSELIGLEYETHFGDVTDFSSVQKALPTHDTVFHLAGVIAYRKSDRDLMNKVNVGGTQNILNAIRGSNITRLVYLSSVVAIGAGFSEKQILNEKSEYNIHHLNLGYFETKHQAELLVKKVVDDKQVDSVILNPSTIYGAGDAKKGSRKTQLKVARGEFKFYTSGGVNVIDVEDCVEGILSGWKIGKAGERYILAGENLSIQQLFSMIAAAAGKPSPNLKIPSLALYSLGAMGDLLQNFGVNIGVSLENAYTAQLFHWFENTKAIHELGLKPRPAIEAINKSVSWMKERGLLDK